MTIKNLVRLLATVVAILALTTGAMAQQQEGKPKASPEERAEQQTKHMTSQLGLSPEQAAKVKEINLKYAQQQGEHRGDHESMMKMTETKNAELKQVLTEEQYQKHMERSQQKMEKKEDKQKMKMKDKEKNKSKKGKGDKKLKGKDVSESEG